MTLYDLREKCNFEGELEVNDEIGHSQTSEQRRRSLRPLSSCLARRFQGSNIRTNPTAAVSTLCIHWIRSTLSWRCAGDNQMLLAPQSIMPLTIVRKKKNKIGKYSSFSSSEIQIARVLRLMTLINPIWRPDAEWSGFPLNKAKKGFKRGLNKAKWGLINYS